jgi:DNA-binding XRE family transcriptional regulator
MGRKAGSRQDVLHRIREKDPGNSGAGDRDGREADEGLQSQSEKGRGDVVKQKALYLDEWLSQKLKKPGFRKHFRQARLAVEVAHQIVLLREKLGITQAELARRMGTKQQTVSRLESGDYEGFTLKTLLKIAEATRTQVVVKFTPVSGTRAV